MSIETKKVESLVGEVSYVFKATVTQLNATNEQTITTGTETIAHVDEAHFASPLIGVSV